MMAMMLWRIPVSREAITIAVKTPMTMPSTVRKLRNLCPRTLLNDIASVSLNSPLGNPIFIELLSLGQSNYGIESCSLKRWIDSRNHSNSGRDEQREKDVPNCYRHGDAGEACDRETHSPCQQQSEYPTQRA